MKALSVLLLLAAMPGSLAEPGASPAGSLQKKEGQVRVYLQPFGPEAGRLRFRVDSLSVVSEGGSSAPAEVTLGQVAGEMMDRERRLAGGGLPAGSYSGLQIRFSGATLEGSDGRVDLKPVSEEPVRVPVSFTVHSGQVMILTLEFDFARSVKDGFRFEPSLVARPVVQPPVDRLGLVSNPEADSVTLYDKISGRVVGVIPAEGRPSGMALDSRRRRAYVALPGKDRVMVIGLLEYLVVEKLLLQGGDRPVELVLTPDGRTLLTANSRSRTVSVIDAISMVETDRITVGDRPGSILVDAAGQRAYVLNSASSSVTVLDIPNRAVVGTISTDGEPFRGQFNGSGDALYVIHRRSPHLTVIDPTTLAVTRRVFLGSAATGLKVDPRTDLIYLSPVGAATVEAYDPASFLPVESYSTGEDVAFLAIDGESSQLHVALQQRRELLVFHLVGNRVVARAEVEPRPYWVTVFGDR